jgi:pimeloyl-ACP methyl ester carboxylesterase
MLMQASPTTLTSWHTQGLYVREYKPVGEVRGVVLFVHGATVSSTLFDLAAPGYSVLQACAQAGWWSFACDLTAYGHSSRPASMSQAPQDCPLQCSGEQAVRDVLHVTQMLAERTQHARIALVGGSWGSITAARCVISQSAWFDRLALLAPLFASINELWLKSLRDPQQPQRINPQLGGYRRVSLADLLSRWDPEIPDGHVEMRRDPVVVHAMLQAELAADPQSQHGSFRVPNGTLHDLFEVFNGRALYAPENIRLPSLLVRGGDDQTSSAADAAKLYQALGSQHKQLVTLPHCGHFMQAERSAPKLHQLLLSFLNQKF